MDDAVECSWTFTGLLIAAFQLAQLAALAFVRRSQRRRRRPVDAFETPCFDFFGRGRRRKVLVKASRLGSCDVAFGEGQDLQALLPAEWAADQQLIPNPYVPIGLAGSVAWYSGAPRTSFRDGPLAQ